MIDMPNESGRLYMDIKDVPNTNGTTTINPEVVKRMNRSLHNDKIVVRQRCSDFNPDCKEDDCCECCLNYFGEIIY